MGVKQPNIIFLLKRERMEFRHAREGGKRKGRRQGNKAWDCQHLSMTPVMLGTGWWAAGACILAPQETQMFPSERVMLTTEGLCLPGLKGGKDMSCGEKKTPHPPAP